jgi:hypothetical protein
MTDGNIRVFRVLSDEPTAEDAFGSHEKIARAISDLIDKEETGKSISLVGDWGSGKSSVVEMLKNTVEETKIAKLFVFNAWAHKDDSIRRAFLEKLIHYFSVFKSFPKKRWNKVKKILSKRLETTRTENYFVPTKWTIALAISIFLVPLGIAMAQVMVSSDYLRIIGLVFAGAPLIVLIIGWLRYVRADEEKRQEIRSLFIERGKNIIHSKSYKTPEPTSIEFQDYFADLMEDGLNEFAEKFIIVIDNIDRVNVEYAKKIWASMRTFFETENIEIRNRLWLIVPISDQGIRQIWDDDHDLNNHFESKTFQVRFNIAPAVLKDWREYFVTKLREALPECTTTSQLHTVYRVYRSEVYPMAGHPTPRDIIIFINKIGAIYLQRGHEIPLKMIAAYVALNTDRELQPYDLRSKSAELLRAAAKMQIGEDYAKYLAAIHYNVPVDKALCVLLGPEIQQAIEESNSAQLKKLSEAYGFEDVLEEVIDDNISLWADTPSILTFLANSIDHIAPEKSESSRSIWNRLCSYVGEVKAWPQLNERTGQGIATLINYKKDNAFCVAVIKSLSVSEPAKDEDEKTAKQEAIEEWVYGVANVFTTISNLKRNSLISDNFMCPGDGPTYIKIMQFLIDDKDCKDLAIYFRPSAGQEAVNATISTIISEGSFGKPGHELLLVINRMDTKWSWNDVALSISNRIKMRDQVTLSELEFLLDALIDLSDWDEEAKAHLRQVCIEGYFYSYLSAAANKNARVMALSALLTLEYNPKLQTTSNEPHIPLGIQQMKNLFDKPEGFDAIVAEFSNLVIKRAKIGWLLGLEHTQPDRTTLITATINIICQRDDVLSHFSPIDINKYETVFYNALADNYRPIIAKYIRETPLLNDLKNGDFDPDKGSLYLAAYLANEGKDRKFIEFIVSELAKIDEDTWIGQFTDDCDNLYDVVEQLSKDNIELGLGKNYEKALLRYTGSKMKGKDIRKLDASWQYLIKALDASLRRTHIANVADNIIERDKTYDILIDLYGSELLDCEVLQTIADDIVRKAFGTFFEAGRLRALRWLSEIFRSCPDILKKSNRDFRKSLKESVRSELGKENLESDEGKMLSNIAAILRIEIPKSKLEGDTKISDSE